jgi:hypothetical protein
MLRLSVPGSCVLAALSVTLSCADCERTGCDSLGQRVIRAGTGISGVVAASSDLEVDGCTECPLGQTTLAIWRSDSPVSTAAQARALVDDRAADATEDIDGRYDLDLQAGPYLLCVRPNCVGLIVEAGERVTVNLKLRNGPTSFFVGHLGGGALEEDYGSDVGY